MDTNDENLTEVAEAADPELIELVAYLDGELDANAEGQIERRLIVEADLRKRADLLDKTWHLLDSLEEVSASGQFTQRTLASISSTDAASVAESTNPDSSEVIGEASPHREWSILRILSPGRILISFISAFIIAAAGFELGQWRTEQARSTADIEMLQKIDLLNNYFSYRPIPDVQFLQDLKLQSLDENGEVSP